MDWDGPLNASLLRDPLCNANDNVNRFENDNGSKDDNDNQSKLLVQYKTI